MHPGTVIRQMLHHDFVTIYIIQLAGCPQNAFHLYIVAVSCPRHNFLGETSHCCSSLKINEDWYIFMESQDAFLEQINCNASLHTLIHAHGLDLWHLTLIAIKSSFSLLSNLCANSIIIYLIVWSLSHWKADFYICTLIVTLTLKINRVYSHITGKIPAQFEWNILKASAHSFKRLLHGF